MQTLRDTLRDRALEEGFDAVGFAPANLGGEAAARLNEFLSAGFHGDMGWMAARAPERAAPTALWPDAKTAIVVGLSYAPKDDPLALLERSECGVISVYARGSDYHDLMKARLKRIARWLSDSEKAGVKVFVDTAPLMEKPLAMAAGIGWQGKHTNLVSRDHGSWLFLGSILTTLDLGPDLPHDDRCGSCSRCLEVCPTAAFPAPYKLDARRCISYLTIEHKGPIPRELRPLMGNRIYGCDDCLAVCPWNKFAAAGREAALFPRIELTAPRLAELARLDDAAFRQFFSGSPIKRTGRDRFVRNVLIAIGNSKLPQFIPIVEDLLTDEAAVVRGAAIWALDRLSPAHAASEKQKRLAEETDPQVREEWAAI
ncbi:MAG: tRNA epoxyqueuosine(34) reductase QueG [Alphaproteobacteria bacterium]|nr:tRNA epoxyqueuosine(34) reductase QueG [Alphaproteobacteria bacterium]